MKKQSGFTLIELMVVMAIIAILATAGLSAYTGYIKKARDAKRMADITAINTIILSEFGSTGFPPATGALVNTAIKNANNNRRLADPLEGKSVCLNTEKDDPLTSCVYVYRLCDSGLGYAIGARLESTTNHAMYLDDPMSAIDDAWDAEDLEGDEVWFEVGNCNNYDNNLWQNQPTTPLRSASAALVRWYDDIWECEWASVGKLS